jgi:glutaredoxin
VVISIFKLISRPKSRLSKKYISVLRDHNIEFEHLSLVDLPEDQQERIKRAADEREGYPVLLQNNQIVGLSDVINIHKILLYELIDILYNTESYKESHVKAVSIEEYLISLEKGHISEITILDEMVGGEK